MMSKQELANHVAHYQMYGSLPVEIMEQLFAAALAVAVMKDGVVPTEDEFVKSVENASVKLDPAVAPTPKKGKRTAT